MKSLSNILHVAMTLARTGLVRTGRIDRIFKLLKTLRAWGPTAAAGYTASALRFPNRTAIIDELGSLTFREVHERTNALANSLRAAGISEGDGVAIMCRNHRWFVESTIACSKLGANALYLNTAFAGPQVADVINRERPAALIYDEEFDVLVSAGAAELKRFVAWPDDNGELGDRQIEELIANGSTTELSPPTHRGKTVILTSGTTGRPKGAKRKQPDSIAPAAALFSKIPLKARQATLIAAPLFHGWGYALFNLSLLLSSTLVLRRRFDPEATLKAAADHECSALIVVPVMLQRIMRLEPAVIDKYDLGKLRIIAASGSTLPGSLASEVMDVFGDVLYNFYGSTEVAWATIATPAEMRAAPNTAGTPPRGTTVKLFDAENHEVKANESGRIFVSNEMLFEGYTGGDRKACIDDMIATGDVGHFDNHGRLFVDGRDDEMVISGGENVFPREVEDLLAKHEAIDEAAVVGVDDSEFGQRLKAFVVTRAGAKIGAEEIKRYVRTNLARYKVPRDVVFVDELPRNSTGKVLKRELAR